jgi:uncharacterized protein (TIGR03083 family)
MDALAQLDSATAAFARALTRSDANARLAAIDWSVEQLAAHLGAVHRWAAEHTARDSRKERDNVPVLAVPMQQWYEESRSILLSTLRERDPDAQCYTISLTDTTVRFWHRRQLHETLVHLWDLESAADGAASLPSDFDATVYADGVSELFEVFLPRVRGLRELPLPGDLRLEPTDVDYVWTIDAGWNVVADHASPTAANLGGFTSASGVVPSPLAATVRGTAGDLLLFVWNRLDALDPASRFVVDGNAGVVEAFRAAPIRP